jgi:hypothetical protein
VVQSFNCLAQALLRTRDGEQLTEPLPTRHPI